LVPVVDENILSRSIEEEIGLNQKLYSGQQVRITLKVKLTLNPDSRIGRKAYALRLKKVGLPFLKLKASTTSEVVMPALRLAGGIPSAICRTTM
jgi:hypothetical protein